MDTKPERPEKTRFIVGVFCEGKLVAQIGNSVVATLDEMNIIVGTLIALAPIEEHQHDYIAFDYANNWTLR